MAEVLCRHLYRVFQASVEQNPILSKGAPLDMYLQFLTAHDVNDIM